MGRKSKGFKIATARSKRAQAGQLEAEALAIRSDPAHTLSRLSSSVSRFAKAQVGDASGNYGPEFLVTDHSRQAVSAAMTAAHGPARVTGGTELPPEIPPTATAGYFSASSARTVGGTHGPEYLMPIADGIRRMNEIPVADRTIKGVPADILKIERLQELIGQAPAHERAGLERRFNATARAGIDLDDSGRIPFPPGSREYESTEKILRVLAPLDREARLRVISGARTKHTAIQQEINTYPAELRTAVRQRLERELGYVEAERRALDDMKRLEKEPRLERIAATQYHDLQEKRGAILSPLTDKQAMTLDFVDCGLLVVEHDWSAAFANAGGDDFAAHEVRLPYECTVLEMRVCGMHVCAHVLNHTIDDKIAIFCRNKDGWFFFGALEFEPSTRDWLFMEPNENGKTLQDVSRQRGGAFDGRISSNFGAWIARQARSIAVALDAEVATREVVRAEYKLNRERERRGKPPIYDYHVVRLAHRLGRPAPVPPEFRGALDADRPITRKRLHFRRGHWRHFPSHRTWIRWMMCGDPALGFIDKEYRI